MNNVEGFHLPKYKPGDLLVHKSDDLDIIEVIDNAHIGMTKFEEYWKDKKTLMYRLRMITFDRKFKTFKSSPYSNSYRDTEEWYRPATEKERGRIRKAWVDIPPCVECG